MSGTTPDLTFSFKHETKRRKRDRGKVLMPLSLFKSRGKFFLRISFRISFPPLSVLLTRTESYAYVLAAEEVCLVTLWHFQFLMQADTAGKEERERK